MNYEWDPRKAASNKRKHHLDPLALTFPDPAHSFEEHREITSGCTLNLQLVFVSPCERKGRIRVIGAGLATRTENQQYEEGIGG